MWASEEFRLAVCRVRLTQASPQRMLTSMLRISAGEAFRRVHAAEALAERMSMTGEPLDPVRPLLAAAQRTGEISSEHPND